MHDCRNATDGWVSWARDTEPGSTQPNCVWEECRPAFDDTAWATVNTPHDWSAAALPTRAADTSVPVVALRNGTWLFSRGDNSSWSSPSLPDSHWEEVTVPGDWREPPLNFSGNYAWYRRHFTVTVAQLAAAASGALRLALGVVSSADDTFVNGIHVGSTGSMGSGANCDDRLTYRSYPLAAGVLNGVGADNVVAVRVWSAAGDDPAGLFDIGGGDARIGALDPGASPGQRQTGYAVGGVGWYRKNFTTPAVPNNGRVFLRFDGVYMNAAVFINGHPLGIHPYGYTTFQHDITDLFAPAGGAPNNVAVRVDNWGSNSRWYSGSGIYRHVWLTTTPAVYIPLWGVGVSTPVVSVAGQSAVVQVELQVANSGNTAAQADVQIVVSDASGRIVATMSQSGARVPAGGNSTLLLSHNLTNVALWSPQSPSLYVAKATITAAGGETDAQSARFGIRTFKFSAARGFELNGSPLKLYGGCVHHANGPLGAAAIDRADARRVELLKSLGYNAIRTSHNPVSEAFLDAADEAGVLVMEEAFDCWSHGKNADDYNVRAGRRACTQTTNN